MKNRKILIVDDEQSNVLLLTKILASHGYTNIVTTISPLDVAELYKKDKCELVILDINMPEKSGYEVLKELQSLSGFESTKVIASSGDISQNHIRKALDAGFDGYLTKPMKMQDILEVVDNMLSSEA